MNQIDLKGRHAVVTGGAQGLGFAIAERLLASGASVSLWDRDAEILQSASVQLQAAGAVTTARASPLCSSKRRTPGIAKASLSLVRSMSTSSVAFAGDLGGNARERLAMGGVSLRIDSSEGSFGR